MFPKVFSVSSCLSSKHCMQMILPFFWESVSQMCHHQEASCFKLFVRLLALCLSCQNGEDRAGCFALLYFNYSQCRRLVLICIWHFLFYDIYDTNSLFFNLSLQSFTLFRARSSKKMTENTYPIRMHKDVAVTLQTTTAMLATLSAGADPRALT